VENGVVSFGQGCEGEPLMQAATLEAAIRLMRSRTSKGTINLNSNAGLPGKVRTLFSAGLDSLRVSMNSAQEKTLSELFQAQIPVRCGAGIHCCRRNRWKILLHQLFHLSGITDTPAELEALLKLLKKLKPGLYSDA